MTISRIMKLFLSRIGNRFLFIIIIINIFLSCSRPTLNRKGEYVISSPKQLLYFSSNYGDSDLPADGCYILGKDIDMSGHDNYAPPKTAFLGQFDGRGHSIKNLTIICPDESNIGFFRSVGNASIQAVVKNLALTDIYVVGKNTVGGMVGMLSGTIEKCYVSGEIHAMAHCAGGIIGRMPEMKNQTVVPELSNCFSSAAVICEGEADSQGGLCGRTLSENGIVKNCICTGEIEGYKKTGGLIGEMGSGTMLLNSVALNKYISSDNKGGNIEYFAGKSKKDAIIEGNMTWEDSYTSLSSYLERGWDLSSIWSWSGEKDNGYIELQCFPKLEFSRFENWSACAKAPDLEYTSECNSISIRISDPRQDCRYAIELIDRELPRKLKYKNKTEFIFDNLKPGSAYNFAVGYDDGNQRRIYRKTFNTLYAAVADPEPINIACSVTSNPSQSLNFSWATRDTSLKNPTVWISTSDNINNILSCPVSGNSHTEPVRTTINKKLFDSVYSFHDVKVSGLKPSTEYYYIVGDGTSGSMSDVRRVFTAPGHDEDVVFAYLADVQISNKKAEFNVKKTYENIQDIAGIPDFIFHAGDMTENGWNYSQWNSFFTSGESVFSQTFIVPVQGNHDTDEDIINHFPIDSEVEKIPLVYSFDYGCAHFIALNTQYWQESDIKKQIEWMKSDLKTNRRQWNFILLHRAIYAATDHVDDVDIDALRQYLSPHIESLKIDAVLMGHDHSFSRGFIRNGNNADETYTIEGNTTKYDRPKSPLYIVNGTGGISKWYNKIKYDQSQLNRVGPEYEFIDKTSADYNKSIKEQGFSLIYLSSRQMTLDTWFFKWSPEKGYETKPYLFDSIRIEK